MRFKGLPSFPTLVLTVVVTILTFHSSYVFAARGSPSPDFIDPAVGEKPLTDEQKAFRDSTDIAPKAPGAMEEARRLGYFHKYRKGLSALGGYVYDTKFAQDNSDPLMRVSVLYLFPDQSLREYEVSVDIASDKFGAISFARRFIYSRTRFRPYSKLGLGLRIDPNDQLAAFLRYKYYKVFGAIGFELLIDEPINLRFELQTGASINSFDGSASLGLAWAW